MGALSMLAIVSCATAAPALLPPVFTWAYDYHVAALPLLTFNTSFGQAFALLSPGGNFTGAVNATFSNALGMGRFGAGGNATIDTRAIGALTDGGNFTFEEIGLVGAQGRTITQQSWSMPNTSAAVAGSCFTVSNTTRPGVSGDLAGHVAPSLSYAYSIHTSIDLLRANSLTGPEIVAFYYNTLFSGPAINATGTAGVANGPVGVSGDILVQDNIAGVTFEGDTFEIVENSVSGPGPQSIGRQTWLLPQKSSYYSLVSSFVLCTSNVTNSGIVRDCYTVN